MKKGWENFFPPQPKINSLLIYWYLGNTLTCQIFVNKYPINLENVYKYSIDSIDCRRLNSLLIIAVLSFINFKTLLSVGTISIRVMDVVYASLTKTHT